MIATLSAHDRTVIDRDTRCRCIETITPLGVHLSRIHTMGDLQGGLEDAERLLDYTVTREEGATSS